MDLKGRTFIVTGGSSGLGAACARRFARRGGHVVIADVDAAQGAALAQQIGGPVRFVRVDVTEEDGVGGAIAAAQDLADGDGLRGLVNCAGIAAGEKLVGKDGPHPLAVFARIVQINLTGTFNAMRLCAAAMAGNEPLATGERGVIINTSSVAAFEGQIGQAAYAASKGGVAAMTLPAARELARHGVRVVTIAPGLFETPMMASFPDKVRQSLAESCVFPPRFGRPDEYAALAEHVIENSMLNGAVLRLDGSVRLPSR